METKEKRYIKTKFGLCIQQIINANKLQAKENKLNAIQDHKLITSLRKLAASSGVEFSIIQKIVAGKRNPELTTIVSIAEGLGMTEANLFAHYAIVPEIEIKNSMAIDVVQSQKEKSKLKKK